MKKLFLLLFLCALPCLSQTCPVSQATSVNLGICSSNADHLNITPLAPTLSAGQTQQLHAQMVFGNGDFGPINDSDIRCIGNWLSSSTGVATVSSTGLVTGVSAGTSTVSCTLPGTTGAGSVPITGQVTITGQAPPVFTTPLQQTCAQPCALTQALGPPSAVAYNYQFFGTGSSHTPYTYTITPGSLPSGLSLAGSTGIISGTPLSVGTSTFTANVCDSIPTCNPWQMSITVVANNNSFFPLSTTSTLSQNNVAGQNSNYPSSLWGSAASTTVSVTSNIVTIAVANSFPAGSAGGTCAFASTCGDRVSLSGFTTATWLNGLILGTNSSTTGSSLVGPVFNTQGTQVTHSNVGSTPETTVYAQDSGWQAFTTAPFPAAGSTNCTNGNPCAGQTGVLTSSDVNSWGIDYSIPGASGVNKNVWTMFTNPASTSNTVYHPSKTSETYDELIGWPDALGGYFIPFVNNNIYFGHAHYAATGCGGQPCMLLDTPLSSQWYASNPYGLGCSQLPIAPPNNQSAPCYYVDISNNFDPKLVKEIYQYNAGGPSVTLLSHTVLADIPTICPAWKYVTIGQQLAYAKAVMVGSTDGLHDTDLNFALGSGPQNNLGKNMEFHIYNMNSTPACENWDTGGRSGTTMYNDGTTAGLFIVTSGNNYKVNDVINFSIGGVSCVGSVTITGVTVNGTVKSTGGLGLPTMTTNSGCTLGSVLVLSGGSGTGLGLEVSAVGTSASPCCETIWPSGSTSPTATTLYTYGIHGGTISKGAPIWIVNSGYGNTTQKTCTACDQVFWQGGTTTLKPMTSNLIAGHPAIGIGKRGTSTSPPYTVSLWSDPTCTPSSNCVQIATLPTCPGGTINHSSWPSGSTFSDIGPIAITSMQNVPGTPPLTNPANCSTAFGYSIWAADQTGTPRWFTKSYSNTNNYKAQGGNGAEDPSGIYVEMICAPDRVFCLIPTDMNFNFPGNVGLGTDSTTKPYVGEFALTLN